VTRWGFLTNHGRVLLCIARDPGVRLRDIADRLSITERTAHGIVTDLTEAGYVIKHKDGRRNRYQIQAHMPLPEPASQEPAIGEVLALLAGGSSPALPQGPLPGGQQPPGRLSGTMLVPDRPGALPVHPRSPGNSAVARSAASSIRSRRSISSPMCKTNDASSAVFRGLIRAQNAVSLRESARRLLTGARVITCGMPRHRSARRRPSGQTGRAESSVPLADRPRSVTVICTGPS
jgi:MarR family